MKILIKEGQIAPNFLELLINHEYAEKIFKYFTSEKVYYHITDVDLRGQPHTTNGGFYIADTVSGAGRGAIAGSWSSIGGQYTFGNRGDGRVRVYGFVLDGGKIFGRDAMGHKDLFPTHNLSESEYYDELARIREAHGGNKLIVEYFRLCFNRKHSTANSEEIAKKNRIENFIHEYIKRGKSLYNIKQEIEQIKFTSRKRDLLSVYHEYLDALKSNKIHNRTYTPSIQENEYVFKMPSLSWIVPSWMYFERNHHLYYNMGFDGVYVSDEAGISIAVMSTKILKKLPDYKEMEEIYIKDGNFRKLVDSLGLNEGIKKWRI